jgi:hypothetical protein
MFGSNASNPLQALMMNSSLGDISLAIFSSDLTASLLVLFMLLLILAVFAFAIKEQLKLEYKWAFILILLTFVLSAAVLFLFETVLDQGLFYYFNEVGNFVENKIWGLINSE